MWREEIEPKIYMAYNDDGLLEIVIGLGILIAVVSLRAGVIWLAGPLFFTFFLVWQAAKQSITAPRVQRMQLGVQQIRNLRRRWRNLFVVVGISLLLGLVVFVLTGLSAFGLASVIGLHPQLTAWFSANFPLVLALIAALLMGLSAFLVGTRRFYAYALLTLVLVAGGHLLHVSGILYGSLLGVVFFFSGIAHLFHFVHQYPEEGV